MLGDVKRNIDNIGDEQPEFGRAVDAFMQACMDMMNAAGMMKERIATGSTVNNGQMSLQAQILNQLVENCGGTAQQAYSAVAGSVVSAAASYTVERQRVQGQTIRAIKGGKHD